MTSRMPMKVSMGKEANGQSAKSNPAPRAEKSYKHERAADFLSPGHLSDTA